MKICVVTKRGTGFAISAPECDILLCGGARLGTVDYGAELSGRSEKLSAMTKLSERAACGVLCACLTDSRGLMRRSVAVADRGKLLGIADMLHVFEGENYKCGASLGVYAVGGYKVGVCIENDLFFPEDIAALALNGCNLISVFCEDISGGMPPSVIRTYAYIYGVPFVMCSCGAAYFADATGVVASSNCDAAVFESAARAVCREVKTKKCGLISPEVNF